MIKRLFDLAGSAVLLAALTPLLALAGLWVALDSPGPVFFRQARLGRGFRPFLILKFRTMAHQPSRARDDIVFRAPPVTRAGRFLRAWKLDEIPQLWNVLVGDMSLVGPRPEVPKYVAMFRNDYETILKTRPGLTDPASLKYRNEEALLAAAPDPEKAYIKTILPDKIRLAKEYVKNHSLIEDAKILRKTLFAVLRRGR